MTLDSKWMENTQKDTGNSPMRLQFNNQIDTFDEDKDIPDDINNIIVSIKQGIIDVLAFDDFQNIINYIKKIYSIKNHKISKNIIYLLNDITFRKYINDYISSEIPKILNNDSNHSFEDISFYIFLLWLGIYQDILIDLNTYDLEKLDTLFQEYIKNIVTHWISTESREVSFYAFVNLFELINKLSILNEVDSYRKTLIPNLVWVLNDNNKKIEWVLSDIWLLDENKKNILSHLSSKLLINFSHIWYIDIERNDLDHILGDFLVIIQNQANGYDRALSSNFWNNIWNKKSNYQAFVGNMAYTINIMISKIVNFSQKDVLANNNFNKLIKLFLQNIDFDIENIDKIEDVQEMCNSIFAWIYFTGEGDNYLETKIWTGKSAIVNFISSWETVNEYQIESIHHLVMFLPNITLQEYLELWMFLIRTKKFNNFNFEFFKLKTLDIIISKLPKPLNNENINIFLAKLVVYIEDNKIASQLFNTYSRLYLSIAFYYSNTFDSQSIELALEYFTIFFKMGWDEWAFYKYGKKMDDFYYNIWLYKLNSSICNFWLESEELLVCDTSLCSGTDWGKCNKEEVDILLCDTSNFTCDFNKDQAIAYWKEKVSYYKEAYELKLKSDLDRVLSALLENALKQNGIEDNEINRKISVILSNKIFHGISETYVVDANNNTDFINNLVIYNGIEYLEINLFNGYKLFFVYPKIYETIFKRIYDRENYYIARNIKNIITSYLKRKDLYIDHNTWLPNELKLKTILSDLSEPVSFLSIKLNTLRNINNGYSYELWDQYIKEVALALTKITGLKWNVYRLSGAKIWIILNNKDINLEMLIQEIKNVKFTIWTSHHRLDAFIWVVVNDTVRIVEKSHSALVHSKSSSNWVVYYNDDINDSAKNKELLEYLDKLDKAIEDDRVVPFYQPKFNAKTKALVSYEALLRIRKEDWAFDGPYKYLLSAETFWRLISISHIMIRKVFEFASTHEWNFSINLSWDDLKNEKLLTYIYEINQIYQISPKRITFEILEWEWNEWGQNLLTIKYLKGVGFKIAMDDFWAMSSNINRLLDLLKNKQIDYLKIDGKIIKSLVDEDDLQSRITMKLLEWIIESAHIAWVKVIAEFVENDKIARICEFMSIDILQWYYFWIPDQNWEIKREFQERRKNPY